MKSFSRASYQKGSVLLISLMILIVLTLLTFTTTRSVLLQEKMTANTRDTMLALQVAEAAIAEAEAKTATFSYTLDGTNGFYDGTTCDGDTEEDSGEVDGDNNPIVIKCYMNAIMDMGGYFSDATWVKSTEADDGITCGNGDSNCELKGRYIVVDLGQRTITLSGQSSVLTVANHYQDQNVKSVGNVNVYKIIARGHGLNPAAQKVVVSYYAASVAN